VAFSPELLGPGAHDAGWVALRLGSYANLEMLVSLLKQGAHPSELLPTLLKALAFPAFSGHLLSTCARFIESLIASGRPDQALDVTLAVANGPHPAELCQQFQGFAMRLGAPPDALSRAV
jgi:hypothetical protein